MNEIEIRQPITQPFPYHYKKSAISTNLASNATTTRRKYIEHEINLRITPSTLPSSQSPSQGHLLFLQFTLQDSSTLRLSRDKQPPITTRKPTTPVIRSCPALILQAKWSHLARNTLSRLGLELRFHNQVMCALLTRVDNIVDSIDDNKRVVVSIMVSIRRFNENMVNEAFELFKEFYNVERVKLVKGSDRNICAVCLEELAEEVDDDDDDDEKEIRSALKLRPCEHVFHEGCVFNWFYDSSLCPLCRSSCLLGP